MSAETWWEPIVAAAKDAPMPHAATRYESPQLRLLVCICKQLALRSYGARFRLSASTAGRMVGVAESAARRWMWVLTQDGVLARVEQGKHWTADRRAAAWVYVPQPEEDVAVWDTTVGDGLVEYPW